MKLRVINEIKDLEGKKVLLRADFNVSLNGSEVSEGEAAKIRAGIPTIDYLINKRAIVIIATHFGRPDGQPVEKYKLDPVAKKLSQLLGQKVNKLDEIVGSKVSEAIFRSKPGDIIMLENVRFNPEEEKNGDAFAKQLAALADIYVNDAFACSHREHASLMAITNHLPSYAGFLLAREIKSLGNFINKPKHPIVSVIGGSKISTKLGLVKNFMRDTDYVLLGGALANTVLKAKGVAVGKSLIEPEMINEIKKINLTDTKLHIPLDVLVAKSIDGKTPVEIKAVGNVEEDEYILDIGPDTVKLFAKVISEAASIIWNGPMGMFEIPEFKIGTKGVVDAIMESKADVVMGGGDTLKVLEDLGVKSLEDHPNIYVSTGGGAMLEFFEYKMLPAIRPLLK